MSHLCVDRCGDAGDLVGSARHRTVPREHPVPIEREPREHREGRDDGHDGQPTAPMVAPGFQQTLIEDGRRRQRGWGSHRPNLVVLRGHCRTRRRRTSRVHHPLVVPLRSHPVNRGDGNPARTTGAHRLASGDHHVVLASLGFPAMTVLPDLGLLLGASAGLLAWTLLRRGRVDHDWRRLMIASAISGQARR